ncbi:hypothetical protein K2173_027354 [Erythroxylum novogranatense]|uniref:Uncharacterized protein n=1 Tax=Erythroxylum novogranatense TaxID=1862640 RepID=A0AAV8TYR3_9ROSI|nr:hypothetical protein K2173_027354 [Erythroxylum novogranatense]
MSEVDTQIPSIFGVLHFPLYYSDPFADVSVEDSGAKEYIHGRKSLTIVQGLKKEYSYNRMLKKQLCLYILAIINLITFLLYLNNIIINKKLKIHYLICNKYNYS